MKVLSWDPRIILYEGLLSEEECDHLVNKAEPRLTRSGVVDTDNPSNEGISDIRTSYGMFFDRYEDDMIKSIEEKLSEWTLIPPGHGEGLQVLRYASGQEYKPHFDYFLDHYSVTNGGNRLATILMYLSTPEEGGETVFPNVPAPPEQTPEAGYSECAMEGLSVKPKRGDAVLFWSLRTEGTLDKGSLHGSCPTTRGKKYAATKWYHVAHYAMGGETSEEVKHVVFVPPPPPAPPGCKDDKQACAGWADGGECTANPGFMLHRSTTLPTLLPSTPPTGMANLLYHSLQPGLEEELFVGADASAFAAAAAVGLNAADESLPYSTSELNAPEYSTDNFRMFQFKVARCSKRYVHDWRACPFAHPTENARRRDPRMVKYLPIPCPDYKRGICLRGDACNYSHGVYECWLHPAKYRTQLCKEGPNCRRPVCFFAHSVLDLRQPIHVYDPHAAAAGAEEVQASMATALAAQQQQQQQAAAAAAAARLSSDGSASAYASRLSSEEVMNNLQDGGRAPSDAHSAAASVAAILAAAPAGSPLSRAASLTRAASKAGSGGASSASHSPDRSGSPNTPGQGMVDLPAARSAEGPAVMSDAAAALAVLTQQQQAQAQAAQAAQAQAQATAQAQVAQAQAAQAQAQAAAALARLSMDGNGARGASVDLAAATATTQAMLSGGGVPPRMSLDSLLASRQAAAGWTPGASPGATTAAAALVAGAAALPLNEQPFPSGNAPRMSNAVARKLGLAPQRTSLDARLSKLRGAATPPRTSLDGILHALQQTSARSSLDLQQQQALLQHAMSSSQQMAMAGSIGMGVNGFPGGMHGAGMNGGRNGNSMNGYAAPAGYGVPAGPGGAPDMGLHPALLNLVAAQMQQGPPQQMPPGMMPPPGVPNGMHSGLGSQHGSDANMAALMDSLNGWQLNGGAPPPGANSMSHRGSMDGMMGTAGAPGVSGAPVPAPGQQQYYDAKGIWAAASSQEAINNSAAGDA
ncbi:Prolyl 4-hydroxylase subunit alpha-2 [Micractinium conductrix]|uniref:procollagen-proline 4-dioxygenase n=1 Tax=Micractinium conductrix TaxID=554055 RepID=A0A2P6VQM6_9CHLO|nr:Prolyl 4-hydroxylase subunit alpha-2 [Micractinium conductrix]|eukprot:PSC76370.1 Prolyl 4-hydroxylase subunit alpha-2 [Micractinium conductrix]